MRVAAITKLFPNAAEPLSAPFNRQQFAALAKQCELEVLATIPWHPLRKTGHIPWRETLGELAVAHPRTLYVPRALHGQWGRLYAASLAPWFAKLRRAEVLLAAWAYPDGVGVLRAGQLLHRPVVVKVHGSDINQIATMPGPKRELGTWLGRAAGIVCVNHAMTSQVAALGVEASKIHVVENGIDTAVFYVRPKEDGDGVRRAAGLDIERPVILYVGNLKREKGILDLCHAMREASLADSTLVIIGEGPVRAEVEAMVAASADSAWRGGGIMLAGAQSATTVSRWMGAAQVLCLPSWMEGTPNVVREALACGTRVVASAVGGIPALIGADNGQLVTPKASGELALALARELGCVYDRHAVAATSHTTSWDRSAAQLLDVLRAARDGVRTR